MGANCRERNGITVAPVAARLANMRANDATSVEIVICSADGKPACCLYTIQGGGHVIPQQRDN
jgi:poly(3-hydroxybutyrate) depolymerase